MATDTRIEIIANALALAAQAQGVVRVADLDFEQMAAAVEAINGTPAEPTPITALDPEGDGLTPRELNAANDG
jgi:hypothetical protein